MRDFFWKHRINLNLKFVTDASYLGSDYAENWAHIREDGDRGTTFHMHEWAFKLSGNPLRNVCSTFVHEFGHLLGLPDEYPEAELDLGEWDSVMRDAHGSPSTVKSYPRHLRIMLGDFCS